MMYAAPLFWFLLALPGYAILRRRFPGELDAGLLGVFSLSTLATLVVLSPLNVLFYLTGAPLWLMSAACLLLALAAIVDITRGRGWRDAGRLVMAAAGIELLIVLLDGALGAWNGSFFGGDARVHVARIRHLFDHGFTNLDPFMAEPHFYPIYHTNLHHALVAVGAKLSGQDVFGVWSASLGWAKLLICGGAYYLAWRIFGRAWPAWIAALSCLALRGPIDYAIYPNQLAPYWILPLMIGFASRPRSEQTSAQLAIKLAGASLVLGQFHALYAAFAAMLLGPAMIVAWISDAVRSRSSSPSRLLPIAALGAGLPFVLVSRAKSLMVRPEHILPIEFDRLLARIGEDWVIRRPETILNQIGNVPGLSILAVGVFLALSAPHRRRALPLLCGIAVCLAIQLIPPLTTAMVRASNEAFILERLDCIVVLGLFAFGGGATAFAVERFLDGTRAARIVRPIAAAVVLLIAGQASVDEGGRSWRNVFATAALPEARRHEDLHRIRALADFLSAHVPTGSVVLADPVAVLDLVQAYDCRVVAAHSASNGVPDMPARFYDMLIMLDGATPWPQRRSLLEKYAVGYYFSPDAVSDWVRTHSTKTWSDGRWRLARLNSE